MSKIKSGEAHYRHCTTFLNSFIHASALCVFFLEISTCHYKVQNSVVKLEFLGINKVAFVEERGNNVYSGFVSFIRY